MISNGAVSAPSHCAGSLLPIGTITRSRTVYQEQYSRSTFSLTYENHSAVPCRSKRIARSASHSTLLCNRQNSAPSVRIILHQVIDKNKRCKRRLVSILLLNVMPLLPSFLHHIYYITLHYWIIHVAYKPKQIKLKIRRRLKKR